MKSNFKALSIVTLALGAIAITSCNPEEKTVEVTDIEITSTPDPLVLNVGGTGKVEAAVVPSNATDKDITWSVAPEEGVVEVAADGTVTAVAPGYAVITATAAGDTSITETIDVTVNTVIEDAQIELIEGAEENTVDLKMLQVSFATGMPAMDITVPGVTLTATLAGYTLSGEGIVPTTVMGGNTVPVAMYTITGLTGGVSVENISFVLMCGPYPLNYSGSRSDDSEPYTGSLVVSPALPAAE